MVLWDNCGEENSRSSNTSSNNRMATSDLREDRIEIGLIKTNLSQDIEQIN